MASADVLRHRGDFPENIWSDCFDNYSADKEVHQMYAKDIEKLKEEVRMMFLTAESNIVEKLTLIEIVERLGLSYHFEEEIEKQLETMFNLSATFEDHDLCTASLLFRIFRQHGYRISSGIFDKFVDEKGKFKESLSNDIKGMLSLFEAVQLRTHEDSILEEAFTFTTTKLKEKVLHFSSSSSLMKQVNRALNQSLHRGVPRLEARHYITAYEEDESRNEQILRLAKQDYNLLQMLHKEELSELLRWWKELKLSKLPYIRDRLVECYFWCLIVYFEPQYSFSRIIFTKIIVATSVLDDTIDAYSTADEIPILNYAIQRWEETQGLTGYIKTCVSELFKIYQEVSESLRKEGSSLGVHHLKEAWKQYARCSNVEAQWSLKGELPTFAEYLSNAFITSAYYLISIASFLGMKSATKEVFDWVETTPKIVLTSMAICRLANDVASYNIEKHRGNSNGIDCYMKYYNVSEQEAMDKFEEMVEDAWKEMNLEMLRPMTIPREILMRVLNLARAIDVIYKRREDGYTQPHKVIAPHIVAMLLDPIVL